MIVVRKLYPAAYPRPIAIDKNKYTSSSGSLMGVLNLTIDRAPIMPKDKAILPPRISSIINKKEEFDLLENNLQELIQYVIKKSCTSRKVREF